MPHSRKSMIFCAETIDISSRDSLVADAIWGVRITFDNSANPEESSGSNSNTSRNRTRNDHHPFGSLSVLFY